MMTGKRVSSPTNDGVCLSCSSIVLSLTRKSHFKQLHKTIYIHFLSRRIKLIFAVLE